MKINLYIEINGKLVEIDQIQESDFKYLSDNCYYQMGYFEIINSKGEVVVDKDGITEIFISWREFVLMIFSYRIIRHKYQKNEDEKDRLYWFSSKLSTTSSIDHPLMYTMTFREMNNVKNELEMLGLHSRLDLTERKDIFYGEIIHTTERLLSFITRLNVVKNNDYLEFLIIDLPELLTLFKSTF